MYFSLYCILCNNDIKLIVLQDGDVEQECLVKVDDCGFYIYWKSQYRVSENPIKLCRNSVQSYFPYGKHLKAIQTKSPFSKVRIQLFSIKEVEIALFPDFYGNCITTAAPLIYEKSLLSVWKGQCVEYVWNALSYRVLRRKRYKSKWFLYCLSATFEIHWSTL